MSVGAGNCTDSIGNVAPYCDIPEENFSNLSSCLETCTHFSHCQAVMYGATFGCRLFFNTIENANQAISITQDGAGCHEEAGGSIVTTDNSSLDEMCYVKERGKS